MNVEGVRQEAIAAEKAHEWSKAAELFLRLAHHFKDIDDFDNAARMFMRAATAGERYESWRMLGQLWVQCASSVNHRSSGAVADLTDETDSTKHYFPTLDTHAWERFAFHEQLGRAWRNAAYHLEQSGVNQTAYVQYDLSGRAFYEGRMWDEASRSYYYGLLSFIERHGEIDEQMRIGMENANRALIAENKSKYLRRAQLYYRGLASKLISKGNYGEASALFCLEADITRKSALLERRFGKWLVLSLWKYSSGYGRRPGLWAAWAIILFFVAFPILFRLNGVLMWHETARSPSWFDYSYFSLATVTPAHDSSFSLTLWGKVVSMAETMVGFIMLGFLLTFLGKKISR
jgi:hypothetical protein